MCRLYGLHATHATRAACELLDSQNALIQQSREDERGLSNPHGWGMGRVQNGRSACRRQVQPASESTDYRDGALQLEGETLLAHVRRATVGTPSHANTHPFRIGSSMLIHNGHVPAFSTVRSKVRDALSDDLRRSIRGDTDSEHVFALLLEYRQRAPEAPLHAVTRQVVQQVRAWSHAAPDDAVDPLPPEVEDDHDPREVGLNLLWTDGTTLAGSRLNRSLWCLERAAPRACPICGSDHADPPEDAAYRSTVLASERLTEEDWREIPDGSVFSATDGASLTIEPLGRV